MGGIFRRLKRLRLGSLNRGDYAVETERSVENTDALVAARHIAGTDTSGATGNASFPPNYVTGRRPPAALSAAG